MLLTTVSTVSRQPSESRYTAPMSASTTSANAFTVETCFRASSISGHSTGAKRRPSLYLTTLLEPELQHAAAKLLRDLLPTLSAFTKKSFPLKILPTCMNSLLRLTAFTFSSSNNRSFRAMMPGLVDTHVGRKEQIQINFPFTISRKVSQSSL